MKRTKHEVSRWRMQRQLRRRKSRWLEAQSTRQIRLHALYMQLSDQRRRTLWFALSHQSDVAAAND